MSVVAVLCPCAVALDPSLDISQYAHTSWRVRDGFAKGFLYSIAQTPDGYLWLGTEFGLLRFDGVRAIPWQPPTGPQLPHKEIPTLLVGRDGALWIGTFNGVARWKDGNLKTYAELNGHRITALTEARDGTVWIGTRAGKLCAFQHERIECHNEFEGAAGGVRSLYEDSHGNLFVGGANGFWKWRPGESEFLKLEGPLDGPSFGEYDQKVLIGTQTGLHNFVKGQVAPYSLPGLPRRFRVFHILSDRDGGLWIGTIDHGLLHYHQGKTDAFLEADGLSGDAVIALFQDREGNIWAVTANGIDRFRNYAVPNIGIKQGLSNADTLSLLASKDGSIWIGTYHGLNRWKNGHISVFGRGGGGTIKGWCYSLFQDSTGRIWVSTLQEFGYLENDRFVPVIDLRGGWAFPVAEVPAGHLWVAVDQDRGLFHLFRAKIVEHIPWASLGHKDHARVLLADPSQHGLWLGFRDGGVSYFADGAIRKSYSAAEGLGAGKVNGLRVGPDGGLWAATDGGLSRIKDGHVATLTSKDGLPCDTIHWSIEHDQVVWLYTACGLSRIPRAELDAWIAAPTRSLHPTVFDASDGVPSHTYSPLADSVTIDSDGKIWFAAFDGVSVIDPRHLTLNNLPPPVHVESIRVNGKLYELKRGMRLPPEVRELWIDYTALSLAVPEKVRFRYKLEGQDQDWTEVVNDRKVQYTNLPPRNFRFRVIACNNSGVWNETGDTLEFSIAPAYYQTSWFVALCVTAILTAIWALHRLRLYQIAREFNAQLDGRVDERLRVARDLHDTLLQTFQAALIQMQAAYNMFSRRPEKAVETLQKAITTSAGAIAEGRDAIQDMRASAVTQNDLARALRVAGDQMAAQGSATFEVMVQGSSRDVHPILRDEVYRISLEAMRNAFQHAEARAIEAEILYADSLRVRIRDNGKGIDLAMMKEGRSGHYGLAGMRERAERIGGKLDIWTGPGAGTEIQLSIPGTVAFSRSRGGSLFRRFRRKNHSQAAAQS